MNGSHDMVNDDFISLYKDTFDTSINTSFEECHKNMLQYIDDAKNTFDIFDATIINKKDSEYAEDVKTALENEKRNMIWEMLALLYLYFEELGLIYNNNVTYDKIRMSDETVKKVKEVLCLNSYNEFESNFGSEMAQHGFVEHEQFKKIFKYSFGKNEISKSDYKLGPTTKEKVLLFIYGFLSLFIVGIPFYLWLRNSIKARNRMEKTNAMLDLYYGKTKSEELSGAIKDRKSIKKFLKEISKSNVPALGGLAGETKDI